MPEKIKGLFSRENLSVQQRNEMFLLLSRYFEGVTRDQFEQDLAEKNWAIEIRIADRLVGFSTLLVDEAQFEGQALTAIYSGDTIVAPEAWGKSTLARTWIAAVNHLRDRSSARPCYWLLLTSGFRTYRFLPVFWREFFPRYDLSTPPYQQRLLDFLAEARYGECYDKESGIVRFSRPQNLRDGLRLIPAGREADHHISYFLSQNPGHIRGDELVCLTEISEGNLTRAGMRMVNTS